MEFREGVRVRFTLKDDGGGMSGMSPFHFCQ